MFSCDKVITIPQYKETSWFNAILMAIFYSQHSRKMLYHHFEDKKDKFSRIMNDIIKHNYIKTEQSTKYFEFMRPENILKYMNTDTKKLFNIFKHQGNYNFDSALFLPYFLKSLNKNVLDIIIFNDNCYANFYSAVEMLNKHSSVYLSNWSGIDNKDTQDPDYIIVHKIPKFDYTNESNLFNIVKEGFLKNISRYLQLFILVIITMYNNEGPLNLKNYGIDIKGLFDLDDKIYHNGNTYILDSIVLNNDIAGITCKNNRYVYSSQLRNTQDQKELPCELLKFDWDVKKDNKFCLNSKLCQLDAPTSDVCYSFNDIKYATLIYVKQEAKVSESVDRNLSLTSSLTLPSLKSADSISLLDLENSARKERKAKQEEYKKQLKDQPKMISCENVITIPQTEGTCWFNAILMAIFYSQHSRKLLYHHFEGKEDKFSRIMNDIVKHNYIKSEQSIKYFEFMKPQNILKYMDKEFYQTFKRKKQYGFYEELFLPFFLKSLNKNVLDIIIYNYDSTSYYANYYSLMNTYGTPENFTIDVSRWSGIESKDIQDPEYILVHKCYLESEQNNVYTNLFYDKDITPPEIKQKLNLKNYGIDITGLKDLNNEIFYNGNKYVLDSALLSNYNGEETDIGHAIAGITCKNNRYVYNGWIRTTNDPVMPKNNDRLLPCELMKFDWDVKKNEKFCLNREICKLDKITQPEDLCFSFNKLGKSTLIYVKDTSSIKSVDTNLSVSSVITLPSLKSNSSDFSELDFDDIDEKSKYIDERKSRRKEQEEYKTSVKK